MKKDKINFIGAFLAFFTLLVIWVIGQNFFFRWDLTSDNRYSLSQTTKKIIEKVKEPLLIEVLLQGEIPSEYKRLQSEILQLLQEYQSENKNIVFRFVNPISNSKKAEQNMQELAQMGIFPAMATSQEVGKSEQSYFFPWAIVSQGNKVEKVALLKQKLGSLEQEKISLSVQNLEYAFTDAIAKMQLKKRKKIAVLRSHQTLSDIEISDFLQLLGQYYNLAPFSLEKEENPEKVLQQLSDFDLLIVPKPLSSFTDVQKQIIDQYVMKGKSVLWLIDQVNIGLNDLYKNNGTAMAMPIDLNLNDLLFKYGVRLNYDLLSDLYFSQIVIAQGEGNQSQYMPIPWVYHPMILSKNNHLITNNLDAIRLQFSGSIDTLSNSIKKHILLQSSPLSKLEGTPREIRLEMAFQKPERESFQKRNIPTSVLLEGNFTSVYKNRILPFPQRNFQKEGAYAKMIIVADGDIIRNDIRQGMPLELGYDKWTNNFYDNKAFLQNSVNYLLNDTNFLQLRNKKVILSALNREKIIQEKRFWQSVSFVFPLLFLVIFAGFITFLYKKRFNY